VHLSALCAIYFVFVLSLVYAFGPRLRAHVNLYVFDILKLASLIMKIVLSFCCFCIV
jgi:hypothetical protein